MHDRSERQSSHPFGTSLMHTTTSSLLRSFGTSSMHDCSGRQNSPSLEAFWAHEGQNIGADSEPHLECLLKMIDPRICTKALLRIFALSSSPVQCSPMQKKKKEKRNKEKKKKHAWESLARETIKRSRNPPFTEYLHATSDLTKPSTAPSFQVPTISVLCSVCQLPYTTHDIQCQC